MLERISCFFLKICRFLWLCLIWPSLVGILSWLPFSLNLWCHILNAGQWLVLHWSQFVQILWQSKWTALWTFDVDGIMMYRLWWYLCLEIQPIKSLDELLWLDQFYNWRYIAIHNPVYYQLIRLWYRVNIKNLGIWNFGLRLICQF